MKETKASLLLHPLFVSSLFLLLANDFYWKHAHPNWLTGKISDFAGLMVLPIFCFVLVPGFSRKIILLLCAVVFSWWKSSLSQPLLDFLNVVMRWPVARSVDYSDLFALFILPLTLRVRPKELFINRLVFAGAKYLVMAITLFSFCATSMPYRSLFQAHPNNQDIYFAESFTLKQTAADVLQSLEAKQISYRIDSIMYYPVLNQSDIYYRQSTPDSVTTWKQVSQGVDSTLYLQMKGAPYYLIPAYRTENHSFQNIRFTLAENDKHTKTTITIQTFQEEGLRGYEWIDKPKRKMLKAIFEKLFSN